MKAFLIGFLLTMLAMIVIETTDNYHRETTDNLVKITDAVEATEPEYAKVLAWTEAYGQEKWFVDLLNENMTNGKMNGYDFIKIEKEVNRHHLQQVKDMLDDVRNRRLKEIGVDVKVSADANRHPTMPATCPEFQDTFLKNNVKKAFEEVLSGVEE